MLQNITTDIHSHILPCLDDGAKSISETIEICKMMHHLGYKKLITTPHNQKGWFHNPPEKIYEALNKVNVALSIHRIPIDIKVASEYYLDDLFIQQVKAKELLTFGKQYVLIELSPFICSKTLWDDIKTIFDSGYIPVLAHPERYIYFYNFKEKYHKLKEMGVKFQLNLISLSPTVSKELRCHAEYLVDQKLIDFCGSDSHSIKNPTIIATLKTSTPYYNKLLESNLLLNETL
ncbi:MAG: capsular biosynthesis protein [Bacteroidales bacterium]|nr:capsular biosynthesis protein [Bacteroidales bacterium]